MKRFSLLLTAVFTIGSFFSYAGITLNFKSRPAPEVFSEIMRQSGKNFVYESSLLKGKKLSISAKDEPLQKVLGKIFDDSSISWKITGNNVILFKKKEILSESKTIKRHILSGYVREKDSQEALAGVVVSAGDKRSVTNSSGYFSFSFPDSKMTVSADYPGYVPYESEPLDITSNIMINIQLHPLTELEELVVTATPNSNISMRSSDLGHFNMTRTMIMSTPALFSEPDIVKSLQLLPGVAAGVEGLAGMYVHGGNHDENLYMLDNVPLYQINHLGGLFSAFNTESIKNVDFYKTSVPAKYDGRLSSFMDVTTKDGNMEKHQGSIRLGLTSGQFNIDGPIFKNRTSYSVALRRSWLDVFTVPIYAILNHSHPNDKNSFRYAFTDFTGKISHKFSEGNQAHILFYYGRDELTGKMEWTAPRYWHDKTTESLKWGNIVAKAGWNRDLGKGLFSELSLSWSKYASSIKSDDIDKSYSGDVMTDEMRTQTESYNNISDLSARLDFTWTAGANNHLIFGGGYTFHTYLPQKIWRRTLFENIVTEQTFNGQNLHAHEAWIYAGDDWDINNNWRISAGLNASLYSIYNELKPGISPRLSIRWNPDSDKWSFKAAYSRTTQYIHQLAETYVALPTDRWIPLAKGSPAQTADKISAGAFWNFKPGWIASTEIWQKWMHNIVDFMDDYYLINTDNGWDNQLTRGKGNAKGLDFSIIKESGKLKGQISYSLMWNNRTFDMKNQSITYPARNDNRHKINIRADWEINSKWSVGATWIGMSGNRYTLATNTWTTPSLPGYDDIFPSPAPAPTKLNNFRLPFYHRLDLSARRNTKRGYWTFSIYNAYCNMNVIGIRRTQEYTHEWVSDPANPGSWEDGSFKWVTKNKFQYIRLFPIIPSLSYTWLF